jgi:mono/diheme cytochrome c family protein
MKNLRNLIAGANPLVFLLAVGFWLVSGAAQAQGNAVKGGEIAKKQCSRCHVVSAQNRYGGIDSTPSFFVMARTPVLFERIATFFERRPHPSFVRVPGVERWSKTLAYAIEFTMTLEDIEDVASYIKTLKNKTLPRRRRR